MLLLLQTRGRLSAPELARELEVSERTVLRDIEALSAAGVPVYTERGRLGGVALLPGYRTDVSGLTADEARALFAFGGRGGPDDGSLESALRKLLASLPEGRRPEVLAAGRRVVVDPTGWRREPDDPPALAAIREAVWADRRLRLRYRTSDAPVARSYTVDPWGLLAKAGSWYLIAAHRNRPRLFRVSRIQSAEQTGEPADRPADLDLEETWRRLRGDLESVAAPIAVELRIRRGLTARVLRLAAAQLAGPAGTPEVDPDRPTWERVTLPFRAVGAARAALLGFGADVEVLSPPEVRTDFVATAHAILARYGQ
jgi:predicted DNA-binding transcriptional regulator YafY